MNISLLDGFFLSPSFYETRGELDNAKAVSNQLLDSIEWLSWEADRQKEPTLKNTYLMEIESAKRQLIEIERKIKRAEKNEQIS